MESQLTTMTKMVRNEFNNEVDKLKLTKGIAIMKGIARKTEELQNRYRAQLDGEIKATVNRHEVHISNAMHLANQK